MSQLKIEIGLAIKAAREKQGIIQAVLAERSGVSRVLIGLIERGQYNNPSVTVLEKIADGLGMELGVTLKTFESDIDKALKPYGLKGDGVKKVEFKESIK